MENIINVSYSKLSLITIPFEEDQSARRRSSKIGYPRKCSGRSQKDTSLAGSSIR
jgi:hypothetical protein